MVAGSKETQSFYDDEGWRLVEGVTVDAKFFGVTEDGPIRVELHRLHIDRIRSVLVKGGPPLNLLDCGCGAAPKRELLDLCARYTGVDFSETGLRLARSMFSDVQIPHDFCKADACALPFADGTFDAVHSAHMVYHIDNQAAQEKALTEMARVVRPGGVIVIVAANLFPLAFPLRLARQIAKVTPGLGALLERLRPRPPLPYRPMSIGWMRRRLSMAGSVEAFTHSLPSTYFNQRVTEFRGPGRLLWKAVRWLDVRHPRFSAYLGNYVTFVCIKC
jgi:ubiquinone/menaquinone biosynthesis C-methylase UbiE